MILFNFSRFAVERSLYKNTSSILSKLNHRISLVFSFYRLKIRTNLFVTKCFLYCYQLRTIYSHKTEGLRR